MAKAASPIMIERKVAAATGLALLATIALEVARDEHLINSLPAQLQPFARVLLPVLATAAGGYLAKHSLRTDVETLESEAKGTASNLVELAETKAKSLLPQEIVDGLKVTTVQEATTAPVSDLNDPADVGPIEDDHEDDTDGASVAPAEVS